MTITAPNSSELVKDGKATPVLIQYLDQFKNWINGRQDALDAEAAIVVEEEEEASKLAQLPAHNMEVLENDFFDVDGIYHSFWLTTKANLIANGPVSNTNFRRQMLLFGQESAEVYYLANDLLERVNALEEALVKSGQLEIT